MFSARYRLVHASVAIVFAAMVLYDAAAQSPQALLEVYRDLAAKADPGFRGFSAERGMAFYFRKHAGSTGERACASCHGPDPRKGMDGHSGAARADCTACHPGGPEPGRTRPALRREILPLAPSAEPARFTDFTHAELWFDINCTYVLGRRCTAAEKGDLITWLLLQR